MSKKIYEVTTKHTAYFTYWVEADNAEDADYAALALTFAECRLNDEINYETDIHDSMEADTHGEVFDADEVLRAQGKDEELVDRIWMEAYR